MKYEIGIILLLFLQYKNVLSNVEQELQTSMHNAMQCTHRDPPVQPVIALTPKRLAQLVGLLRKNLDPPVCDTERSYPYFQIEDDTTWPFCVFGKCKENRCRCFRTYTGPSCARDTKTCWLMYCFLKSCHPSLQSINCRCDPKLYGTEVLSGEYWYDDGKRYVFEPPPYGWQDGIDLHGENYGHRPQMAETPRDGYHQQPAQQINFYKEPTQKTHRESQWEGMNPDYRDTPLNAKYGDGIAAPNSFYKRDPARHHLDSADEEKPEDTTEDVEKALEELEQETSSSTSVTHEEYLLCLILIVNILISV